jgi:hypothetical protein
MTFNHAVVISNTSNQHKLIRELLHLSYKQMYRVCVISHRFLNSSLLYIVETSYMEIKNKADTNFLKWKVELKL